MNGTELRIDLARPLPPKGKQALELAWSFPFGANSNRMGVEDIDGSTVYEVAQWYPRMAVYDDVRGWNTEQYLGQGEFYLEYGSFDVSLTVPADMIVAATGTLQNPDEVLTRRSAPGWPRAHQRRDGRHPRQGRDRRSGVAAPTSYPTLTWHFTADSVRDFSWAAARHFVWDAVGVNGGKTLAMSFYPPSAELALEGSHPVRQDGPRVLLEAMGALPVPLRQQRERHRGRDGVSHDRLLP